MRKFLVGLTLLGCAGSSGLADNLAEILGSSTNEWRFARSAGTVDDYKLAEEEGRPVLIAGPNATLLTGLKPLTADSEITVRLRLAAANGKATSFYFAPGLKNADETDWNPLFLNLHVAAAAEQETVICQMPALPGETQGVYWPHVVRTLPKNRDTWPAFVRARAEQDFASEPTLSNRWLTLRCVIRANAAQVYLEGLLLRDTAGTDVRPTGHVRLSVFEGAQLGSVRIRSLLSEDPLFETVELDHTLNAGKVGQASRLSAVGSEKIDRQDACPALINGIPFLLPTPDDRGDDHIDVGRSWMRFGALEGAFDPWDGELARWVPFQKRDAGRLAFRVRKGPYTKLHLLASFDGEPDNTPVITAQFYRRSAGHPVSFSTRVPKGKPRLVTIPLEPEGLASFSDLDHLDFELTKEVRVHRAFPDPCYYSQHGAGLPSGVHVYAMTLERPAVEVDFQPDNFAHIWTAPEKPSYTVRLRNNTAKERSLQIEISTLSHGGAENNATPQSVRVPASGKASVTLPLKLKRYGYHAVKLQTRDEQGTRTQTRSLAYLHPDTRERDRWAEGKGPLWGMWDWNGGHETPSGIPRLEVAQAAGIESAMHPFVAKKDGHGGLSPEEIAFMERHNMTTHFLGYQLHMTKDFLGVEWDASKPEEMKAAVVNGIKKSPWSTPTKVNQPELCVFFAEPLLGAVSYMSLPEYYGDPPYQMTAEEQKNYKNYHDQFVIAASAIKKEWPHAKMYMPWGIASFPIPFLRHSKEATALLDGPAVDQILFERLPEMQVHQVTFASTLWQFKQEWIKAGKPWPTPLITVEGGGLPSPATPGGLTQQQEADHLIRGELVLAAYGVTRHLGLPSLFRCAGAWGEQHYGGGLCERLPLHSPKIAYSQYATMTRQRDGMNYVKTIETGSASVFCLQFKHYKTRELLHVLWTLRGKRPVTLDAKPKIAIYDSMDNLINTPLKRGVNESAGVTFTISTSPCYVWGLKSDAKISLGEPDHSDAKPSETATRMGNLGDGSWTLSTERDSVYEDAHPEFVRKFHGKMTIHAADGGKALAVRLEKQEKERQTMPFYTTLLPAKPITIPGKPSHLGLWVKAASDWGRFVYCLRDAKGERWVSIGKKGEWNVDDVHCWSAFNFDGWRYLCFEMPGNAPWDCFREAGTSFWGYYDKGDGIVDLPLSLENIIVERRTHVIKVDELIPANPADVLLGDLYVEYEKPADKTAEAERLSRLRMGTVNSSPAPAGGPDGKRPADNTPFK